MSKRNRKTEPQTNHTAPTGDEGLDALMNAIGAPPAPAGEEVVEPTEAPVTESELEAAVSAAEVASHYAEQPPETPEAGAAPTTEGEKPAKKAKREKLSDEEKAKRKAEREAAAADRKAKREVEKAARPKRVFYGKNKIARLTALMGEEKLRENMVFTISDAALSGDELKAKIDANIALVDGMSIKVKNRATYLLEFAHKGAGAKLNEVIRRAFEVLHKDGNIKTGDSGNYHAHLLAKPYDAKTARATGNNTVSLLKQLQVLVPHATEKQTYVLNPDSLIGAKVNGLLGYTTTPAA